MTDAYRPDLLSGKRALVTGGGRGIGEATVRQLARMGAEVVIADRDLQAAQEVADTLRRLGLSAAALEVELSDRAATLELPRRAAPIDVLVNNAAPVQTNAPFVDIPDEEWELQLAVVLWAPMILSREIGRTMCASGRGGAIVNVSSVAVRNPMPFVAPYAAAKAGLEAITKATATEFGPGGVRVNAVAPSFVPTERNRPIWDRPHRIPAIGRMPDTQDVANTIAWLASPAASYLNGQVIALDGGTPPG